MDEEKELEQEEEVLPQAPGIEQTLPEEEAGTKKGQFSFNEYLHKLKMLKIILPLLPVLVVIILIVIIVASSGGKSYDYSIGKGYIEGTIEEEDLIDYLINMQYCDDEEKCKKSPSYQFYQHFKSVYDDYLTDKEVTLDTRLLIATLSYYRSDEEMFAAIKEIDLLADAMVEEYEVEVEDPQTHQKKIITKYRINLDQYKIYILGTDDGGGTGSIPGNLPEDEFKYFAFHESGSNYGQVGGDHGHAYGYYQFDNRYALQPFLQQCYQYNSTKYAMFEPFLNVSKASLQGNQELYQAWKQAYNQDPEEFSRLQDEYEYNNYYLPVERALLQKGIDISSRRDVIKGLVCGISNLMGSGSAANKIMKAGVTNMMSDEEFAKAVCGEMIAHPPSSNANIASAYAARYREELKTVLQYLSQPAREG